MTLREITSPTRPLRLLLVDHDAGVRFAMGDYFRRIGIAVDAAANCVEADAWLSQSRYDAVVTDIRLTVGCEDDGLRLARRIRLLDPEIALCILTLPAAPSLMAEAETIADVVLLRPRGLPDVAQVVLALLHQPRAPRFTSTGTLS